MDHTAIEVELLEALGGLLYVMNPDKDGGYFICEEAESTVEEARRLIDKVRGGL